MLPICNRCSRKSAIPAKLPSENKKGGICVFSLPGYSQKRELLTPDLNAAPDAGYIKPTTSRSIIISACFLFPCCELGKVSRFYSAADVSNGSGRRWRSQSRHQPLTSQLNCAINAVAVWRSPSSIAHTVGNGNK
jgi:hypothetical protein